jgi:hypothetical protein
MAAAYPPVSWERMENAVQKLRERLLRAASALAAAGIPYAVAGESAVAAWVSRVDEAAVRNTRDVDVLLRRADFEQVKAALEAVGFVYRQVASLGKAGVMDVFLDRPDAKVRDAVHVLWAGETVTPDSADLLPDVTQSESAGEFQLIALPSLVQMKLSAWRDKDRMHLRDLIDVGLVDDSLLPSLSPSLQLRLREILAAE